MTFVDKILAAGFVEQGMKHLVEAMPHQEKWVPRWWERYDPNIAFWGVDAYHPDAWFTRSGDTKEFRISFCGLLCGASKNFPEAVEANPELARASMLKYFGFYENGAAVWETFTGKLPPDDVVAKFIAP